MAGEGFEPSKAEPRGLQPRPFDRSGIPPSAGILKAGAQRFPLVPLAGVPQPLRLGQRLELLERVVLDLANPFACDVERTPDLLERLRSLTRQPEPQLEDLALARAAAPPAPDARSRGAGSPTHARTVTRPCGPRRSRPARTPPPRRSASRARSAAAPCAGSPAPRAWCTRAPSAISSGVGSRPSVCTS